MSEYFRKLANLRSGFYCTLCDADFNAMQHYMWEEQGSPKYFYLGNKFCADFTQMGLEISLYFMNDMKKYLEAMVTLLECEKETQKAPFNWEDTIKYEIPDTFQKSVLECKANYFENHSVMTCQNYCQNFDLTTVNPVIDGDILQVEKFIGYMQVNKSFFLYPTNNFMVSDIDFVEKMLKEDFVTTSQVLNFFESNENAEEINVRNTKMHLNEGIDLFRITKNNDFPLNFESSPLRVFANIALFVFSTLFMFK